MNKTIKLETPEDKTNNIKRIKIKETIRNWLDELKIMKINFKIWIYVLVSKFYYWKRKMI